MDTPEFCTSYGSHTNKQKSMHTTATHTCVHCSSNAQSFCVFPITKLQDPSLRLWHESLKGLCLFKIRQNNSAPRRQTNQWRKTPHKLKTRSPCASRNKTGNRNVSQALTGTTARTRVGAYGIVSLGRADVLRFEGNGNTQLQNIPNIPPSKPLNSGNNHPLHLFIHLAPT